MAVSQYLAELIRDKKWAEALRAGEQLLLRQDNSTEDLAWIHFAISAGRMYERNDYMGGLAPGFLAAQMARKQGLYWLYGRIHLDLSMACLYTRQYDRALANCAEILRFSVYAGEDRYWFEAVAQHNIGFVMWKRRHTDHAVSAYEKAVHLYEASGRPDRSFVAQGQLLMCIAELGSSNHLPALLLRIRRFIRSHRLDPYTKAQYLYYSALYRLSIGHYQRAADLAVKSLQLCQRLQRGRDDLPVLAHMLLFRCAIAFAEHKDALGHALAARMKAIDIGRYDQEFEAIEGMLEVIEAQGSEVVQELDRDYQIIGLDLSRFVSETVLPQRN